MSTTTSVKLPEIPGELWMLWKIGMTYGDDFEPGWCVAYDDPPGGENYGYLKSGVSPATSD